MNQVSSPGTRDAMSAALEHGLRSMGYVQTPAAAHGLLTGCLTADPGADLAALEHSLGDARPLTGEAPERFRKALERVRLDLLEQLRDPELSFAPLYPEDDAIEAQAQALAEWVDGFIGGLGQMPRLARLAPSAEVTELLRDFAEITRIEPQMEDDEETAIALEELKEYVRVGVLLMADELAVDPTAEDPLTPLAPRP